MVPVPRTAKISNQSTLKEINPEYSLEGLILKLKLQYFDHMMQITDFLERLKAGEGDNRVDEMVGWHHQLNGHEFEQTLEDHEGQGSLAWCSLWGHKELDMAD